MKTLWDFSCFIGSRYSSEFEKNYIEKKQACWNSKHESVLFQAYC